MGTGSRKLVEVDDEICQEDAEGTLSAGRPSEAHAKQFCQVTGVLQIVISPP
jgi:hypothetical protein